MNRSRTVIVAAIILLIGCDGGPSGPSDAGGGSFDAGRDASAVDAGRPCERTADCDDGDFCNGMEMCVDAVCVPGAAPCDPITEVCTFDRCVAMDCSTDASADADDDSHRSMGCDGDDCDDNDGNRYPGNAEVCDVDGHDEDCDPTTYGFRDSDTDHYPDDNCCNGEVCGTDCDDMMPSINPGTSEVCGNGVDDNCNGLMDEGLLTAGYADADGDGYGDEAMPRTACLGTPMFSAMPGDCDELDPSINPGATDSCDGSDNDCDDAIDEGLSTLRCFEDSDGDGFGGSAPFMDVCGGCPAGWASNSDDCNDGTSDAFPGQTEWFPMTWPHYTVYGDWNCDERTDLRWSALNNRTCGGLLCTGTGWVASAVPECGVTATWRTCFNDPGVGCMARDESRTQECR